MTDSLYIIPMHYNCNVLLTTNHIVYAFQCRAFCNLLYLHFVMCFIIAKSLYIIVLIFNTVTSKYLHNVF